MAHTIIEIRELSEEEVARSKRRMYRDSESNEGGKGQGGRV